MIIILFLSLAGFIDSFYLYYQHQKEIATGKKMFCLLGEDCSMVVGSKYGKTFGIKNELIGMTYYIFLASYSLIRLLLPSVGESIEVPVGIASMTATVFSLYLLYIQTFVLKKFCSWCLMAIAINILIFYLLL